jgi:precorrin-2/cobalt-factor-2 C20-methyltransferase
MSDLTAILRLFDTVLLLKVSSVMPEVVRILEAEGLLDVSYYVSRATMEYEKVVTDIRSIQNDKCDYFSMIVVSKRGRSGILAGRKGTVETEV